jgi:holo-[acyl-carrier protein] synthase
MEVGVDIVEIHRIARQIRNPRFLKRVYTAEEVAYCRSRRLCAQHFAVRFAAKEAVWKAVGEPRLLHRDIQVRNRPDGKPEVVFPKAFARLAPFVSISLSHGREYAVAMAVFCEPPRRRK